MPIWHQNLRPPPTIPLPPFKRAFEKRVSRIRHRVGRIATMSSDASYVCDACGEEIVIPIDAAAGTTQEYVEDCPVCCRASVIHVELDHDGQATLISGNGSNLAFRGRHSRQNRSSFLKSAKESPRWLHRRRQMGNPGLIENCHGAQLDQCRTNIDNR